MVIRIIRLLLTAILTYYIYKETGIATMLGFLFVALSLELMSLWMDAASRKLIKLETWYKLSNPKGLDSRLSQRRHAELLIQQLPPSHDGRNTWLLNHGVSDEAREIRRRHGN